MKENNFKRNFKLYVKQKNVIIAFVFLLLFIITFIISCFSNIFDIKGIRVDFKHSIVNYVTTNNYSVTYAASKNRLFYSQSKDQASSLNNLENIKSYDTAYGSSNPKPYNFITINYDFDSNIIKVCGIPDKMDGTEGKTYILTSLKSLYVIYNKEINKLSGKYDNVFVTNYESFALSDNTLYKIDNDIMEYKSLDSTLVDFVISNQYEFYNYNDKTIKVNKNDNSTILIDKQDKIVETSSGKIYGLNSQKIVKDLINDKTIDNEVDDIYSCGEDALIINKKQDNYYIGELKHHETTTTPTKLEMKGKVIGNRNSLIVFNNGKLYLYDKNTNEYQIMYHHSFLQKLLFGFSIFVVIMIMIYFILSFKEANERYNRYFSKQLKRIDEE